MSLKSMDYKGPAARELEAVAGVAQSNGSSERGAKDSSQFELVRVGRLVLPATQLCSTWNTLQRLHLSGVHAESTPRGPKGRELSMECSHN